MNINDRITSFRQLQQLQPGDWVSMRYGHDRLNFVVAAKTVDTVQCHHPEWLNRDTIPFSEFNGSMTSLMSTEAIPFFDDWPPDTEFSDESRRAMDPQMVYLGRTRLRWLFRLIPCSWWTVGPIDLFCPYPQPRCN